MKQRSKPVIKCNIQCTSTERTLESLPSVEPVAEVPVAPKPVPVVPAVPKKPTTTTTLVNPALRAREVSNPFSDPFEGTSWGN